jgi:UDP-N-acetylglucosamine acyltransferase
VPSASSSVHPTAVVHAGALIEEGADIGPYAVIGPQVVIRNGAVVGAHAVLEYAEIGPGCRIFPGAFVGLAPQDTGYQGQESRVIVGARTVVRECVTIHRSKFEGGTTRVGERCMLMAYSHVAHDCRLGNEVLMANSTSLGGHVEVGDGAFISALIAVHQYSRIGRLTMISGGTIVTQDIPPFCMAQGDRAALYGLNLVGLKRAGFDPQSIAVLKAAYKTAFSSGLSLREAVKALDTSVDPNVKCFAEFLKTTKRGVTRP